MNAYNFINEKKKKTNLNSTRKISIKFRYDSVKRIFCFHFRNYKLRQNKEMIFQM